MPLLPPLSTQRLMARICLHRPCPLKLSATAIDLFKIELDSPHRKRTVTASTSNYRHAMGKDKKDKEAKQVRSVRVALSPPRQIHNPKPLPNRIEHLCEPQ